jgi:hypothetical protein
MKYLRYVNFGFARLIWRPFIRSTEKRGRSHFFEECSLHIPLRLNWFEPDIWGRRNFLSRAGAVVPVLPVLWLCAKSRPAVL